MNPHATGLLSLGVVATIAAAQALAASPVVVDATGRVLGFYQAPTNPDVVRLISTQGYVAKINMKTAAFSVVPGNAVDASDGIGTGAVYYAGLNCTGDPFYSVASAGETKLGGWVFWSENDNGLWFVPKAPTIVQFTAQSGRSLDSGSCSNTSFSSDFTRAYPNDPGTTGVSNTPPVAPLRIEVATVADPSGLLLRDGFETIG